MAQASTLHDAFLDELRDVYHAEKQITKALPKMVKAASNKSLAQAFADHLKETEGHVARIEEAFSTLGETVKAKPCEGMKGILDNLIHRLEIPDLVVAFTDSPDRLREYANDRRHATFIAEELLKANQPIAVVDPTADVVQRFAPLSPRPTSHQTSERGRPHGAAVHFPDAGPDQGLPGRQEGVREHLAVLLRRRRPVAVAAPPPAPGPRP